MADSETSIIRKALERAKRGHEADKDEKDKALDDLKFLDGEQWDSDLKMQREGDGRPCLTINLLDEKHGQVIGEQRKNRPAIKVKPVDSGADPETAKILEGLIRNIEQNSPAKEAYDHSYSHSSACGYGGWQILDQDSEYEFDAELNPLKVLRIEKIANPFSVIWDPAASRYDRTDSNWAFIVSDMSEDAFEKQYPNKRIISFDDVGDDELMRTWRTEDTVRVAEYFVKVKKTQTAYLWADKSITFKIRENEQPVKQKEVEVTGVRWYKISAVEILEGPIDLDGRYIPIIPEWGEEINVGGRRKVKGMVRNAKDPSRAYNYSRSSEIEITALAPKVPYLATSQMIGPYLPKWNNMHKKNYPVMLFEPDERVPGARPIRENPGQIPTGEAHLSSVANDEIKATTRVSDAALGARSNETSGKAIIARQRRTAIGTFPALDNHTLSIQHCGRVLIDLIPYKYDTERIIRITNEDGTDKQVKINGPITDPETGEVKRDRNNIEMIYDLTVGNYDVVASTGPSYETQREEAAESMGIMISQVPDSFKVISDLFVKAQDWPGASEISERFRRTIPPELLGDEQDQQIDPQMEQLHVQIAEQAVSQFAESMEGEKLAAEIRTEQAKAEKAEAEAEQVRLENEEKALQTQTGTQAIVSQVLDTLRTQGGI